MKKFVCLVFLLALSAPALYSQNWTIEVSALPSISATLNQNLKDEVKHEYNFILTSSYRYKVGIPLNDSSLKISTGVIYSRFGYEEKLSSDFIENYKDRTDRILFQYLTVPISLMFEKRHFYYGPGLTFSYYLKGIRTTNDPDNGTVTYSNKNLSQIAYGFIGEVGYKNRIGAFEIRIGTYGNILLNTRLVNSLLNLGFIVGLSYPPLS